MEVIATTGTLPVGYCFDTPQNFYDLIFSLTQFAVSGSPVNLQIGATAPTDLDAIWFKTEGGRLEGIYLYLGGAWYRKHPVPAGGGERMLWYDTPSNLWLYQGGSGLDPTVDVPTATTGSFWQEDTDFSFKIPIGRGAGTSYDSIAARSLEVGDTAGAEKVHLVANELPEHTHPLGDDGVTIANFSNPFAVAGDSGAVSGALKDTGVNTTTKLAHENLPPVRTVIVAKRSARVWIQG